MNSNTVFILKILIISLAVSIAIKYGGPTLSIPATNVSAVIGVFFPTIVIAIALLWRARLQKKGEADT